jgi:Uncharacterized conserved protein (COG2071)
MTDAAGHVPRRVSIESLRFSPDLLTKPAPRALTVETTLQHFAIVTYWVEPAALRKHLHPRFEPVRLPVDGKASRSLVSVVTFLDRDFRFVACPWPKWSFGQTNYRAYVDDTETGEQAVWFFGTCLDSISVSVPRYLWKLPWHRAHMTFDCRYDASARRYSSFEVMTRSGWSPGELAITDSGEAPSEIAGVANVEAGLVLLTHPLRGYFFRHDHALGSYAIWHSRTACSRGQLQTATYPLLQKLDLVQAGDISGIHSVLLQPSIDFTIYLPPFKVRDVSGRSSGVG